MTKHKLKDGYYLFIYSEIDKIMNLLKASLRHDHNMALFYKDGDSVELIHHWEFERYTGYKHHSIAFPSEDNFLIFINELLSEVGLEYNDIVEIIGTPFSLETKINSIINQYPNIAYHAISHLYTSMMVDTRKFNEDNIIALAFDGGPDILIDKEAERKNYFCGAVVKQGEILEIFEIPSPGAYWAYASSYFQIPEGTLMALAYACKAKTTQQFDLLPEYKRSSDKIMFEKYMDNLISTIMNYDLNVDTDKYINYDERFSQKENKVSIIMKVVQENSILQIHKVIDRILLKYKLEAKNTKISLSGGYALNCPTNTEVMHHYKFKEQLFSPCVNDGGLAIGMGLNYFHNYEKFNYKFKNAYYGSEDKRDVINVLKEYGQYIEKISYGLEQIANDIEENPIVWFNSRAEIGPRALGHRSILANPCKIEHKDLLNKYKIREWWRPVAPIILEEEVNNWFVDAFCSEYMLNNFTIKYEKERIVPAIMHLDGTCRVQTVSNRDDKTLYEIVKRFYLKTEIPMLCNTSLNDHGEPIINKIDEAVNFALRKNIEILYINGYRVQLKNHSKYYVDNFLKRNDKLFLINDNQRKEILEKENPFNLSDEDVLIYKYNARFHKYNLKNEKDVCYLKKVIYKIKQTSLDLKGLELIVNQTKK